MAGVIAADLPPLPDLYGERTDTLPPTSEIGLDVERALEQVVAIQGQYWPLR